MLQAYFVVLIGINAYFLATVVSNILYLRRATKPATGAGMSLRWALM